MRHDTRHPNTTHATRTRTHTHTPTPHTSRGHRTRPLTPRTTRPHALLNAANAQRLGTQSTQDVTHHLPAARITHTTHCTPATNPAAASATNAAATNAAAVTAAAATAAATAAAVRASGARAPKGATALRTSHQGVGAYEGP